MIQSSRIIVALVVMLLIAPISAIRAEGFSDGIQDTLGPRFGTDPSQTSQAPIDSRRRPRPAVDTAAMVQHWNEVAIDATGLDHTPVAPGENRVFGEQIGPGRSSRAMAIIHLAVFDAINAIEHKYNSYTGLGSAPAGTSMKAAIAQAAHDTLVALYPSQAASFDAHLTLILSPFQTGSRRPTASG